jgi:hypothetical protein
MALTMDQFRAYKKFREFLMEYPERHSMRHEFADSITAISTKYEFLCSYLKDEAETPNSTILGEFRRAICKNPQLVNFINGAL